jgi:xanthine dehydrogenase accessory factor
VKQNILAALVEAGLEARAVVLVRNLADGEQFLVDRVGAYKLEESVRKSVGSEISGELLERSQDALARDGAQATEIGGHRYLIQTLSPPPRLFIIGAVHIAQKLIPMAHLVGYEVCLIDPREAFASAERFPNVEIMNDWPHEVMPRLSLDSRSAVVTLSHDAKIDEPALHVALESDAFYIGALGSKKNHAKRLQRLGERGFDDERLGRIHGPIGLPLGGRSPSEIAIAILAQITQARYQKTAE